jgi:hypothetical protein
MSQLLDCLYIFQVKQWKIKNDTLQKMSVVKKIRTKQLKIKMTPYKKDCAQKNRTKQLKVKNWTLHKGLCPQNGIKQVKMKNEPCQKNCAQKN